ncbi:MAG: hypothetical protein ACJA06_000647 [Halocynthiibacter sp.]|jgi:hypothetical protein
MPSNRRKFLATLLAASAASAAPRIGWAAAGSPAYLAAARLPSGAFELHGLTRDGASRFAVPLPARGHAGASHPNKPIAVAFARRPGTFALVVDCAAGEIRHHLSPPKGLHFNGHGCFAQGGALLLTIEQDANTSEGRIGFWDARDGYRRLGDAPTHGIGPHDLRLMPDNETLIVANGGIATDPNGRRKLNIESMAPSLAYIDLGGDLLEEMRLDPAMHQASIRHLALRGDGLIGFAMQWQGDPAQDVPLLGFHRRGKAAFFAETPFAELHVMQGYAGSIAFGSAGDEIAITSPRGGRMLRYSAQSGAEGRFLDSIARADICGLAVHEAGLLASDGLGGLIAIQNGKPRALSRSLLAWDNHIVAL